MSNIIKKPYKITLWEDKNVYVTPQSIKGDVNFDGVVGNKDETRLMSYLENNPTEIDAWAADVNNDGVIDYNDLTSLHSSSKELQNNPIFSSTIKKTVLSTGDRVINQFLKERCIATIGSDTMDTPIRAFNPVLTEDLNGSRTLTFQVYMKYWDDEEEDFKKNPFLNLLVNERKVKLKYDSKWYDFVIKQISEDSENEVMLVTCKDLFINELGKTGYEVELDTELSNNMGTVSELAKKILENTDWQERDSEHLFQWHKEALFEYTLKQEDIDYFKTINELTLNKFPNGLKINETSVDISDGSTIYIFYSCVAEREPVVQFLFDVVMENGKPKQDEYGFIRKIDNNKNDICYEATFDNDEHKNAFYNKFYINTNNVSNEISYINGDMISNYFGNKLVKKQESKYFPEIGETCFLYEKDGEEYWCYTETEYISSDTIQNLLSNSGNFTPSSTTGGWNIVPNNTEDTTTSMNIDNIPVTEDENITRRGTLRAVLKGGH